ncbi:NAD(P)H-dependent oxidoreductase [Runella sp. SP2]|uniref:NAD(P)H-dependent oxidoreductase n=1 Tax=Runella sp. SP2 TaxID=2268026 RepID=UPI000F099B80|nr:NAD(P)H-dependent oxidoreductase [Runella sp. SP2]AYQ35275.1 NADPH quinone reductase MdaB [Runella sp. SP2]
MQKILVINGGKTFAHSGGRLNTTLTEWDGEFFTPENGFELKITQVGEENYDANEEVEKFVWADVIIYHFPIWWMYLPFSLKEYFDKVLTAGHRKGLYYSDGRKANNPERNYGTGGLMQGTRYLVTTTWNAPKTAFTLPEEFFQGRSVDDGVLFPFHRMNAFCGLEPLPSKHFHDVEKNGSPELTASFKVEYLEHLRGVFRK